MNDQWTCEPKGDTMKYVFTEYRRRENTALNKAPDDVLRVAQGLGFEDFPVKACGPRRPTFFCKVIARIAWCFEEARISRALKPGDVVLLQSEPGFFCRRAGRAFLPRLHARGVRFVYLIHDIGALRERDAMLAGWACEALVHMLSFCDVVIAHNESMKAWIAGLGFPADRIVSLGVFDYLREGDATPAATGAWNDVIVAGNLSAVKSSYLAGLKDVAGVSWKLYGPNFDADALLGSGCQKAANVEYRGSFDPDDLPNRLAGSWGLVWDGDSTESCSGTTGTYLRYNNPHKLSLFLACGIPVVIWREAAEAAFVTANRLGVTVDSLHDIPSVLSSLSPDGLADIRRHVAALAPRLRRGEFTKEALSSAVREMS